MSITYEKKFFKNFAEILIAKEPELMRECRMVSTDGRLGCAWVRYQTLADFAADINYTLTYMSLSKLMTIIRSPSVDWSGYLRMDPKDHFVLAISTPDLDGRTTYKTIGVKDDGGPPDATEIALYPKIAFANQCPGCSKSTARRRVVVECDDCNEKLVYCSVRCRDYDLPHHAALEHAHTN